MLYSNKFVSYYRVSTQKQGKSGLGIDAQKSSVLNFIGSTKSLIAEFEEIESGKCNLRPQLKKAIELCQRENATLLIAKLDRLSRNVSFIYTLRDSKVEFRCCDMPDANSVTIGIMAVLAQDERERISHRTKSALAELKAKGKTLGNPRNLSDRARELSKESRMRNSMTNENNIKATALIQSLRNEGYSFQSIADKLNESNFKTRQEKLFSPMQVKRLYDRVC